MALMAISNSLNEKINIVKNCLINKILIINYANVAAICSSCAFNSK